MEPPPRQNRPRRSQRKNRRTPCLNRLVRQILHHPVDTPPLPELMLRVKINLPIPRQPILIRRIIKLLPASPQVHAKNTQPLPLKTYLSRHKIPRNLRDSLSLQRTMSLKLHHGGKRQLVAPNQRKPPSRLDLPLRRHSL